MRRIARGTERETTAFALTGVAIVVASVVVAIVAVTFTIYYLLT